MIDERRMIVRLQRWLTPRRPRLRQAPRDLATARLPALIAAAADGDQRALRALAAIVVPFVNNYCRVHLGTTEAAQQVAHGISRKILKTLPNYLHSRAPFWGYVYGVAARAVTDAQRQTSPEHSHPVQPYEGPPRQQLVDPGCARSLAQLLATVSAEQREVLVLRVALRLTVEDTAKIVGASPATVRLIQHRALNRLRQELQDGYHDPRCSYGQQPASNHLAVPRLPSTFLCYRRADEPFATALLGTALIDRLGESRVFFDTVSLDRGRAFEAKLIAAARSAEVMLVVVGAAWDRGRNRERLDEGDDWVRREILQAKDAGRCIMLVLVERDPGPIDLPADLDFLRGCETVALRRPEVSGQLAGIADTITGASTAVPAGGHLDPTTVERATLAMIRHVLPDRQQFGGNDKAVARAVADHLAAGEWLRFAGAGNSPGRPAGSGVIMVTDEQLRLVQLRPRRGLRFGVQTADAVSLPLGPRTTLRDTPRRSSSRDLVDVHVEAPGWETLPVLGLFPKPAEILLEVAARASWRTGR